MANPVGQPIIVPAGALVSFSDGRLGSVASGSIATPTTDTAPAGWVSVGPEVVRAGASVPANEEIDFSLLDPPLVPATLEISSLDPFVLSDDGAGTLTGPTGSGGTNTVDLESGIGSCSFDTTATGPITATYLSFGVTRGTVFTIVDPDGLPLGMGTITLEDGSAVVSSPVSGPSSATFESRSFTIDPDPSSTGLSLSDDNLDAETLDLIAAQIKECAELEQHEIEVWGKNLPWFRRGLAVQITNFHDEHGDEVVLPAAIILERKIQVQAGATWLRYSKLIAWTPPGVLLPPSSGMAPAGDAQTFATRGVWQPHRMYSAFDVVLPAATITQVQFVVIPFGLPGSLWVLPALSGSVNPFGAVISGRTVSTAAEGKTTIDYQINAWYGVHRVVTLTGSVSGQSLLVRDAGGAEHYLTFYPSVGRWTDTPSPPGT